MSGHIFKYKFLNARIILFEIVPIYNIYIFGFLSETHIMLISLVNSPGFKLDVLFLLT